MFTFFIKRPVMATVIALLLVLIGLFSLVQLPITQYPDIIPPSVVVTAKYTGANAQVLEKAVATPLERAINGVPGMAYMSSVQTNDGVCLINVVFQVGTDPDIAAVNVQNRITTVLDELPEEVIKAGVQAEKEVNAMLMYLNLYTSDTAQDEKFVYNYADINILTALKRIEGVGFAEIMGMRDYAMRVWLDPERMAAYQLSPKEVVEAIRSQNVEAAPGKTGISSDQSPNMLQYVLKYTGKFAEEEEYAQIRLKALPDGSMLRLGDVATITFGSLDYNMVSMTDGKPSASIMIKQRPGSNARQVIQNIKAEMEKIEAESFPPGMRYSIGYDVSRFLDASMKEVIKTLVEAFLLVSIVVFLFLQDWRSTLIPALAVPVSLIGTFFFMQLFGFSLNLLTLFALVLAIGIVVDDAIVVVEAVHVHLQKGNCSPRQATERAMEEIGGAIVGITLVMTAVFVPISFLDGPAGIFYRQFALTLAIAIALSGVMALTLAPALCSLLLHPHVEEVHPRNKSLLARFFSKFNTLFDRLTLGYGRLLLRVAPRKVLILGSLLLFSLSTGGILRLLPTGFIPTEDQGMVYVQVNTPPGATVERTARIMDEIQASLLPLEEIESVSTLAGYSLVTETAGASYGMGMINLKPWKDREQAVPELIARYADRVAHLKGADIRFYAPPPVPGFGNADGFELRLQNKAAASLEETAEVLDTFMEALNARPEIANLSTTFDPNFPQYLLHVDHDQAARLGIHVEEALDGLQLLIGSFYTSNFIRYGMMYKVMLQAAPEFRAEPESLLRFHAKSKEGELVPYHNFIRMERVYGPEQLTRYNLFPAVMLNGQASPGFSSGDAIAAVEQVAKQTLPRGFSIDWAGITREEIKAGNQTLLVFGISLLFVYLVLAAQYESYILPLTVILSLPTGVFGSYSALLLMGLENNIYAQIASIMLIGLLGKNAILIVEIAEQRAAEGFSTLAAAVAGAKARLRPILMTSLAFVAGLIPLVLASGAGEIGNKTIGSAAAGGMLIGTCFGLLLIPGLYVFLKQFQPTKTASHAASSH
ncbi:hydrophobe/amphiphile efflux-1 (HAE1) family transporter [Nitritalea halalkaliphila LW7]|uniref:Hydrophobe/amphiphile efflux-1 (HAE1) family transporter n=1 Tax=Nitritalea halalkaliphila LW7 TaxID=1189621 RepID=I5C1Z2_9BACT|nr:efflux RND transporter permease subunit [Nitritalea halalkaliphila]EIM75844.1 hydrophobe/amphiphile efflux-1 (HAE1) family transporter [Nitritalea halalkaliphila LW7]